MRTNISRIVNVNECIYQKHKTKEFGYLLSSLKSEWIQTIILQLKHYYIKENIAFVFHYLIDYGKIINTIALSITAPSKSVQINDYFSYYHMCYFFAMLKLLLSVVNLETNW